ncbi:TPA: cyclic nucleotide-binding domain-containing protein [Legionella pneumophila]|uniref:cyclic nucleotide-binding domain-containing protein n=1 Tax=Legionella pneumophila TaxID=446 RepID=UPI000787133A|nr:cyclic nucleotide-binding domain-containing protein [Legionella pneumophila]MDW8879025.1 cyclic nucleotide-binding domain-containing protein [Legionella pneumophila subsp. fraseri]MDW8961504.1 cyclic nucleotide-binding domain-containing protein [Legionella pneumophila subsp. fraseri]MDW9036219.1 cyclic nucleotide-binding domain-containing protein [Legionella pneumophila subsp. fraseri]MDW9039024.1 cyclic nucleotide-binding domain-containing protein [Legionella pneumophila subsp. fraseri]MDW
MNQNDTSKNDNENCNQLGNELIGSYQSITIGFSKDDLASFSKIGKLQEYPAGSIIYNEGDLADSFFIIVEGVAEIFKKTIDEFEEHNIHVIATLTKDEIVGEMALVENNRRSASVKAKTNLTVIEYPLEKVKAKPKLNLILIKNMAQILSRRLRFTNEVTVKNMQHALNESMGRNALGAFIIVLLWIICLYTLSLHFLSILIHELAALTTILSICLISVFAIAIIAAMRFTGLPYSRFGITLKNSWKNTLEAVLLTIPVMILLLMIKAFFIIGINNLNETSLFSGAELFSENQQIDWRYYITIMFLYSLFAPVQELMTRSALQSTFFLFLPGEKLFRKWNAILLSNLIFATMHTHLGLNYTSLTFIAGLFWGWLFHRQQSLIGVSVSHIILGVWSMFIVGLD